MSILKKKKIGLNKKLGIKMSFAFSFYNDQSSHSEKSE